MKTLKGHAIYLIHTMNTKTGADLWIAFDEKHTVRRGKKNAALVAWQREHGAIERYMRIGPGVLRPSEAALEIADVQGVAERAS